MNFLFNNLLAKADSWIPLLIIGGVIVVNIMKAIANNAKSAGQLQEKPEKADYNKPDRESEGRQTRHFSADNSYKTLEQMQAERAAQIRQAQMQGKLKTLIETPEKDLTAEEKKTKELLIYFLYLIKTEKG